MKTTKKSCRWLERSQYQKSGMKEGLNLTLTDVADAQLIFSTVDILKMSL